MSRRAVYVTLVLLVVPSFAGCFGSEDVLTASDLSISPSTLVGGQFQNITLSADHDMSVFVPYLVVDETGFVLNGTVVNINANRAKTLEILVPPRADKAVFLMDEKGRKEWPVRSNRESWADWLDRDGDEHPGPGGVRANATDYTDLPEVLPGSSGGKVFTRAVTIVRPMADDLDVEEGSAYATGAVSGRDVYDWLQFIGDGSADLTSPDGVTGYYDRWIGNGNPSYEDSINYFSGVMEDYGLEVQIHRAQTIDHPEAVNICGYKWGELYEDEWIVFGAHFDIAPLLAPSNPALGMPRGYGTRVGAYDNTIGSVVTLVNAYLMSQFIHKHTMVFCLWSSEEEGLRGSDAWTRDVPSDVTVLDYINLDMAGVSWPGGGAPEDRVGPDGGGSFPVSHDVWPMSFYIGPGLSDDAIDQTEMEALLYWIMYDALGIEEVVPIVGSDYQQAWSDAGEPEVIVYDPSIARSDHASFQDNLGTAFAGVHGLVDGYDCYHQLCDTVDEMEYWMETDDAAGTENLVNSLDVIMWWATLMFFHFDHKPVIAIE